MKRILAVIGVLCLLWLCGCTAKPADDLTEPTQTASETQTEHASTETQTETETQMQTQVVTETQTEAETETTVPQPAKLSVDVADDTDMPNAVRVTADAGEPSIHVVFTTDRTVRNVQVLSLMMQDFDESTGKPVYDVTTVKTIDTLTPEMPLLVTTVFYGDLPNNGIAYTDFDGTEHRFSVEMSGEDGTLFLAEF